MSDSAAKAALEGALARWATEFAAHYDLRHADLADPEQAAQEARVARELRLLFWSASPAEKTDPGLLAAIRARAAELISYELGIDPPLVLRASPEELALGEAARQPTVNADDPTTTMIDADDARETVRACLGLDAFELEELAEGWLVVVPDDTGRIGAASLVAERATGALLAFPSSVPPSRLFHEFAELRAIAVPVEPPAESDDDGDG